MPARHGGACLRLVAPPQDYDDSYCIGYARSHGGCVMSNDLYRDQLQVAPRSKEAKAGRVSCVCAVRR